MALFSRRSAAPARTLPPVVASGLSAARAASPDALANPMPVKQSMTFEEVVERYHGKVFQLVYRYTGDYEEACDLTQDTFVRAYGAWNEFRGDSQIYTWLYRIAINLCHNQQKKLQRRRRVESVSLDAPIDENSNEGWSSQRVADERPLPLQVLESAELRARLHEALAQLPENYRTVIVLRDIEGLTYEEIARITDSTLEAIKSRLFRARNAIRRLMEPYLMGPLPTAPVRESEEAVGVGR
jgi:RNA polymerase sigma-70 factor, ECF subfamily